MRRQIVSTMNNDNTSSVVNAGSCWRHWTEREGWASRNNSKSVLRFLYGNSEMVDVYKSVLEEHENKSDANT